jgi:hypothetical protein
MKMSLERFSLGVPICLSGWTAKQAFLHKWEFKMVSKQTLSLGQDTVPVLPTWCVLSIVNHRMRKTAFQRCGSGLGDFVINQPTGSGFDNLNYGSGSLLIINHSQKFLKKSVFRIRIRIRRIHMFLGLPDPDLSVIMQK